jgi:hypothetical protein
LSFAPGEAYQFDWSHEIVVLNGVTVTVKVAHVRLCHSRMMFVRAYPRETQEMVFDAHDRAFAFFKGACTRGMPKRVRGLPTLLKNTRLDGDADCRRHRSISSIIRAVSGHKWAGSPLVAFTVQIDARRGAKTTGRS